MMCVTVFTDSGCVDFENVVSCGVGMHRDGVHRPKRMLFVKWFDKENGVTLSKEIPMSSVSEFWSMPAI